MVKNKMKSLILLVFVLFCAIGCSEKTSSIEGISMQIKEGTLTTTGATVIITDTTKQSYTYGEWFRIDKMENGTWKELEPITEEYWFNLNGYSVGNDNKLEINQSWGSLYGELGQGKYRLVKKANNHDISVEFEINKS